MLFKLYMLLIVNQYIHELTHYFILKLFKVKILRVQIAADHIAITTDKAKLGINIFGKNEVSYLKKDDVLLLDILNCIIPTIFNGLFTYLIFYYFAADYINIGKIITIMYLFNLIPIKYFKTDGYKLKTTILKK